MKPVIIIAIAVVCSVGAVLGILAVLTGVSNAELQEYYVDLDIAQSYKIQYLEIFDKMYCMKNPPPTTDDEIIQLQNEFELQSQYVERIQPTLDSLTTQVKILQEKYPDDNYFKLDVPFCPYQEEWIKYSDYVDIQTERKAEFIANQYEKCIEVNQSETVCDSKLDEFTELAKLVLGNN